MRRAASTSRTCGRYAVGPRPIPDTDAYPGAPTHRPRRSNTPRTRLTDPAPFRDDQRRSVSACGRHDRRRVAAVAVPDLPAGAQNGSDVDDLHLATVVGVRAGMRRAVEFWSAALGYRPRETSWDADFMMSIRRRCSSGVPATRAAAATRPVRVHLDVCTD